MVRAETGACRHQERALVLVGAERQHFVAHVRIVVRVAARTIRWMLPLRIPRVLIDAVDAVELDPSALEMLAEGSDHAPILPLEEAAHRARKYDDPRTGVTEHEQVHVSV